MPDYRTWYENGKELAARRKSLGWTGAELARRSGVSQSIVANVESGRTALKGELASQLWSTVGEADVKRRERNALFEGYSNAIAEDSEASEVPTPHLDRLEMLRQLLDPKKRPSTPKATTLAGVYGEVIALRERLAASMTLIREQALSSIDDEKRLQDAQEQINNLKAELSALRDQLGADIKDLRSQLSRKLQLAAKQGGEILSENEVVDAATVATSEKG